ncbi:DUF1697 domain-containing protein (plasmid) [Coraliomargarita sp. W4R53]
MTKATEWVALLRGVNVGGITIRNAPLAEVFRSLGLNNVRTVLASGNVTFDSPESASVRPALKASIESALETTFSYDAWIALVTKGELKRAIDSFPFDETAADRQPWVIFCVDDTTQTELLEAAQTMDATSDPVAAGPGVVYWNPAKGHSTDTAFAKRIAKVTYRKRTTNRNIRTLRKLVD